MKPYSNSRKHLVTTTNSRLNLNHYSNDTEEINYITAYQNTFGSNTSYLSAMLAVLSRLRRSAAFSNVPTGRKQQNRKPAHVFAYISLITSACRPRRTVHVFWTGTEINAVLVFALVNWQAYTIHPLLFVWICTHKHTHEHLHTYTYAKTRVPTYCA